MTGEDLFLAIVRKPIVKLADDYFSEQARSGVTARNRGACLFSGDDVLFAARVSTSLLQEQSLMESAKIQSTEQ